MLHLNDLMASMLEFGLMGARYEKGKCVSMLEFGLMGARYEKGKCVSIKTGMISGTKPS
jgi:hypothetical protein